MKFHHLLSHCSRRRPLSELDTLITELKDQTEAYLNNTEKSDKSVEVDSEEAIWREQLEECIWESTGERILVILEESQILFQGTSENIVGGILCGRDEFTGVITTGIKRTDELPRNQITDSDWPKFVNGIVKEWRSILATSVVTIIYPKEALRIRKEEYDRIAPSKHV